MAATNPIPPGMPTLSPNLVLRNCAGALEFYKRALGAEEVTRMMAPGGSGMVWHAELRLGESVLFANDEVAGMSGPAPSVENPSPVTFWIRVADCDAAHRRAVGAGAKSIMEPADMFWGDRCGGVADPYGYRWSFATRVRNLTHDEMVRAGEEFARQQAGGKR
jgi:uncharacterized glyoxalase superfamily protein PhnB